MRQIQIDHQGQLQLVQSEIPKPAEGQVLIKVEAIGVNRADILQREGLYPIISADRVPGLEVSGFIDGTDRKVCALLNGGGYSEYVCAEEAHIIPLPVDFDLKAAAALPEALTTVWMALFDAGCISLGKKVLIHAGTSGIGSFAIQVTSMMGCTVFASVGSDEKLELCKSIGADFCFNYSSNDFSHIIKDRGGVDLILDILGGRYAAENIKSLNANGRMVSIAVMDGSEVKFSMGSMLMKGLSLIGTRLLAKTKEERGAYIEKVSNILMPLVYSGKIIPIIDSIYPLEEAASAHERMKSRKHIGKIILQV